MNNATNIDAINEIKEIVSDIKCNYSLIYALFLIINVVSEIVHLIYTFKSLIFIKNLLVGRGKYYITIRDRFNTSITFTIFNFITCIIFIYSLIITINDIINYFFGNTLGKEYNSPKKENNQINNNFYGNNFENSNSHINR